MKLSKSFVIPLISLGFFLGACTGGGEQAATSDRTTASSPTSAPVTESPVTASTTTAPSGSTNQVSQGGQVVESGPYHLELVTIKEASGTHLDFYLQKGDTHEAIPGAKVTGQVQLPDGSQQAVEFEYDAAGKHYAAVLPATTSGEYKVAVLTDISGEKVNARFNFNQ